MASTVPVTMGVATKVGIAAGPEELTAIVAEVQGNTIGFLVEDVLLSALTAKILVHAGIVAATRTPTNEALERPAVHPIPTTSLGLAPGRVPTEVFLTLTTGNLTLAYAVEVGPMRELCKAIQALAVVEPAGPQLTN